MTRNKLHYPIRIGILVLATGLTVTACSSSSKPSTASSGTAAASGSSATSATGTTITIKNFTFSPMSLTVKPGAKVTVMNKDTVTHTLTAMTKSAFDTMDIKAGASTTFTAPSKAGSYPYICDIHMYMKGTLTVQ
jgi:plastocyanin